MSSREEFEAWMTAEQWFHGSDFEWDDRRNCYSQFGIHLAYKAWVAATNQSEAKCSALAAKGMELAAEAAVVYGKYNETQMPDRDLVDMQTLQEMHDLCAGVKNADALLAEVRASAVDEACLKISNAIVNCYQDEQIGLDAAATICGDFAAQLRQDANTAELVSAGIITKVWE